MRVELPQPCVPGWFAVATVRTEPGTWLRVLLVVLAAFALTRVLPRLVRRIVLRVLDARVRERLAVLRVHAPRALIDSGPTPAVRYTQRAEALGTLCKHLSADAIWLTAVILILHGTVALVANRTQRRLPARLVACTNRTRRPITGRTNRPSDVSWPSGRLRADSMQQCRSEPK
jgi:hypothetical protein